MSDRDGYEPRYTRSGGTFVLCVLTFRRGIVGEFGRVLRRPF